MKREEYVETLVIKNKIVNVGLDDAGQQYFFEFYDENEKKIVEIGCGAYNHNYKQEIEDYFKTAEERILDTLIDHEKDLHELWGRVLTIEEKLGIKEEE